MQRRPGSDGIHLHRLAIESEALRGFPDDCLAQLIIRHLRQSNQLHADLAARETEHAPPAGESAGGKRGPQLISQCLAVLNPGLAGFGIDSSRPDHFEFAAVFANLKQLDPAGTEVDPHRSYCRRKAPCEHTSILISSRRPWEGRCAYNLVTVNLPVNGAMSIR